MPLVGITKDTKNTKIFLFFVSFVVGLSVVLQVCAGKYPVIPAIHFELALSTKKACQTLKFDRHNE
jgi:hypothetical protein